MVCASGRRREATSLVLGAEGTLIGVVDDEPAGCGIVSLFGRALRAKMYVFQLPLGAFVSPERKVVHQPTTYSQAIFAGGVAELS